MSGASAGSIHGSCFTLSAGGNVSRDWAIEDEEDERRRREELEREQQAILDRLEPLCAAIEAAVAEATTLQFLEAPPGGLPIQAEERQLRFPCTLQVELTTEHLSDLVDGGLFYDLQLYLEDGTAEAARALAAECKALLLLPGPALEHAIAERFRRQVSTVPAGVRAVRRQAPKSDGPWNEDLARAITDRKADNDALSVYADWLASNGNPLSALATAEPQTPVHDAVVQTWLESLSPTAAAHARAGKLEFGWNHGFVESLTLTAAGLGQGSELLSRLLEHPLTRFVSMVKLQARPSAASVSIRPEGEDDFEDPPSAFVEEMVRQLQARRPRQLVSLEVHDAAGLVLDDLFTALPALEELTLDHCLPLLRQSARAERLRFLEVRDSSGVMFVNDEFHEHLRSLERLAASTFPMLRTLKLSFFWEPVQLLGLFEGAGVPTLQNLVLGELTDLHRHLPQLLEGGLLRRLRTLALPHTDFELAGRLLERQARALVHLEALDLSDATVSDQTRAALLAAAVRLVTT